MSENAGMESLQALVGRCKSGPPLLAALRGSNLGNSGEELASLITRCIKECAEVPGAGQQAAPAAPAVPASEPPLGSVQGLAFLNPR